MKERDFTKLYYNLNKEFLFFILFYAKFNEVFALVRFTFCRIRDLFNALREERETLLREKYKSHSSSR